MIDEIKKVQLCVDIIKRETEADVNDLREQIKINAQSIDRLCSDKSNGNACMKNDLKTLKLDLKCIGDDLESKVDNGKFEREMEKTTSLLKRVNKIEKENFPVSKINSLPLHTQIDHQRCSIPSMATRTTTSTNDCSSHDSHKNATSNDSSDEPIVTFHDRRRNQTSH